MVCVVHDGRVSSPAHARAEPSADSPVARFLVGASNTPPALEEVRRATLSGVILARVPDHPHQTELRLDAFRTAARHLATKTELHRLFLAWNEAGVVPLVIKGFYLSEFVYSAASLRVYNDVDVYVQPDQALTACEVASRVSAGGWHGGLTSATTFAPGVVRAITATKRPSCSTRHWVSGSTSIAESCTTATNGCRDSRSRHD